MRTSSAFASGRPSKAPAWIAHFFESLDGVDKDKRVSQEEFVGSVLSIFEASGNHHPTQAELASAPAFIDVDGTASLPSGTRQLSHVNMPDPGYPRGYEPRNEMDAAPLQGTAKDDLDVADLEMPSETDDNPT